MKEKHAGQLKKMSIEEREELYSNIKKGQNRNGGTYGDVNDSNAMNKTSHTFNNKHASLGAASWTRVDDGQKGWGS